MKTSPKFSIITSWDWQQLIRLCGPKIDVSEMELLDFKNFNDLQSNARSPMQPKKKTNTGHPFLISKVVHMKFFADSMGILYFKTAFNDTEFKQVDFNKSEPRKTRRVQKSGSQLYMPEAIRESMRPITTKKFLDLQKTLKWVPKRFHNFFNNLSHGSAEADEET
ncbi:unnamed protein product [Acanthoscelides obtectus]|uniref:Uncharacterized protein n=1 Tax=Acanthoscelides obtectus TaxID=200917 RepID=A0A9P0KV18_ACAOB|nr:unnamed protein product [Acanthoscelides obtectus]CAH2000825.1 unnamed protein product [Acanthoscelides obtectus]CAH2017788.1 unnamed protein product [Acanthoscelides obtectus]CAK1670915.1 hypothetical protein AOBTE_LOCUS27915 [Acanthoscelides obtectus]CAK1677101.1 hypothetical protein AOBTE_LOCUS31111 [Acanthoscelides obtectus]